MPKKNKFSASIWTLWISLLVLTAGCSTAPIPNVEFIRIVPFDPPRAVSIELVSRKKRIYTEEETRKMIPTLTALKPEGVQEIIVKGKMQCRKDDKACSIKLDSVGDSLRELDGALEKILPTLP